MKFDFWTFFFQIINFTVLLFILRRLLFKPVREIMEKRRGFIAARIEEAEKAKREAEALRAERTKELEELKEARTSMLEEMEKDTAAERKSLLAQAEAEALKLIEKEKALFASEKKRFAAELKDLSIETVLSFSGNLLRDISDEELHKAVLRRLMDDLERIASVIKETERKDETLAIEMVTAYPLEEAMIAKVRETLEALVSKKVSLTTTIDKTIIAGAVLRACGMVFDSSLLGRINILKMNLREKV